MKLYGGIDLHSNNLVLSITDDSDNLIYEKRLSHNKELVLKELSAYKENLIGLVVESTYNWYWLADLLQINGYPICLANTTAIQQYSGLKYSDDYKDARFLAHLYRLGILPMGYICPKESRLLRDMLRKRSDLVRQKTRQILFIQNMYANHLAESISGDKVKRLKEEDIACFIEPELILTVNSHLRILHCMQGEIALLEKQILAKVELDPAFSRLQTIPGVGKILAMTIMLEVGEISRFPDAGNFASYCRCVSSQRISNGKKKGEGNKKNGNKYLSWAFVEAANFAIRYDEQIKRYYQKKMSKTKRVIAIKTIANKIAKASFYMLRDAVDFDVNKAFC